MNCNGPSTPLRTKARALPVLLMLCGLTASCGAGTSLTFPPAPPFMAPVAVPLIKAGDDPRAMLAAKLNQANSRLTKSRAWYLGLGSK